MTIDRERVTTEEMLSANNEFAYTLRTNMPAEVVSFNEARNTVDVQPLLMRKLKGDATAKPLPQIKDVPVKFYGAGGFVITFKPASGDVCELAISDRSLEKWKLKGGITDPAQRRHHNMSDATAYFGMRHYDGAYPSLKNGMDIRTADGSTGIHLENGTISIRVAGTDIATMTASAINFLVPVIGPSGKFGDVVVETHPHSGVTPGSGQSGGPVPTP